MPKSKLILTFFLIIAAVSVYVGVSIITAETWEEPTCSDPTTCNAPEPINTGDTTQTKTGTLIIGDDTLTKYLYVKGDITGASGNFSGDITADGGSILAKPYFTSVSKYIYSSSDSNMSFTKSDQTAKTPRCQNASTNNTINCDTKNDSTIECDQTNGVYVSGNVSQTVSICYDYSTSTVDTTIYYKWSAFKPQSASSIGGWVTGTNGYNDTISFGGDATGNDLEIGIVAPSERNLISFKNTTLGTRAQIDARFIGELSTSSLITAINNSSGNSSFINSLTQTINSGSNGLLGTWLQNGSYLYTSSTDWNVGIGTNAPTEKLTIIGGNIQLANESTGETEASGNYYQRVVTKVEYLTPKCLCDVDNNIKDCADTFSTSDAEDEICYDQWKDSTVNNYPKSEEFKVATITAGTPIYTSQPAFILNDINTPTWNYSLKNYLGSLELNSGSGYKTYLGQDGYFNVNNGKFIVDASGTSTFTGNVGIGTTSNLGNPSSLWSYGSDKSHLNVTGAVRAGRFFDDDADYYADLNSGANLGGNWIFNDNIGVNVSSPKAKLHGKNNIYTSLTGISATANSAEITISTGIENFDVNDYINFEGASGALKRVTAIDTTTKKITLDSNFDSAISGKTLYLYKPLIRLDNTDDVSKFVVTANGDINFTGELLQNGEPFKVSQWSDVTGGIYYNDGSVGVGTSELTAKLSVQGTVGLLRTPGTSVTAGPGPELFLQSPSSDVAGTNTGWIACGGSGQSTCPSEDVPTADTSTAYTCQSSDTGKTFTDVGKIGGTTQKYYTSLTCSAGTSAYSLRTNDGKLEFLNNDFISKLTIDQSGNVGIGGNVEIGKTNSGTEGNITGVNQIVGVNDLILYSNSLKDKSIYIEGKDVIINNDSGTGNVGIGTTPSGSYKLEVSANAISTGWYISSDSRLKTNITLLTGILPKLGNINAVGFNWKTGGARQIGFIAQEVEKEFPELVNTDDKGYKSLDYSKMSAVLLGAVKELKAENDNLKSRIEKLETSR